MEYTINAAMIVSKALRGRLAELSVLRQECAIETHYYGEKEKVVTPLYDVKKLDKKCVEIENFLMAVDTQIKQSNAVVKITVEGDAQTLLTPLTD
jgi:hypothetical protein